MNKTCARCEKTVYPTEELKCLDKAWHKGCFKCQECGMTLNMRTYKGYGKLPYCESHVPKAKHTTMAETPELKRIAENTKLQSNVSYHADFEKSKGKFTQVADDPETLRIKANTRIISNVAYHGDLERKAMMEKQRQINDQGDIVETTDNYHQQIDNYANEMLSPTQMPPPNLPPKTQNQYQTPIQQKLPKDNHNQHQQKVENYNQQQQKVENYNQQKVDQQHNMQQKVEQHFKNQQYNMADQKSQQFVQSEQLYQSQQQKYDDFYYQDYQHNAKKPNPNQYEYQNSKPQNQYQEYTQNSKLQNPNYQDYQHQNANSKAQQNPNYQNYQQQPQNVKLQNNQEYQQQPQNVKLQNNQEYQHANQNQSQFAYGQYQQPNYGVGSNQKIGRIQDYDPLVDGPRQAPNTQRASATLIYNSTDKRGAHQPQQQASRPIGRVTDMDPLATEPHQAKPNHHSNQRVYIAMYDYEANDSDEVSFREGDLISNVTSIDEGWMTGQVLRTGRTGMLPANYVELAPAGAIPMH